LNWILARQPEGHMHNDFFDTIGGN
jgi:hypothetical protein